jgi:hypothetical protein
MRFSKDELLAHVDSIIDRQQQDLEELLSSKPKIRSQLERAKLALSELRMFRRDLASGLNPDNRLLASIEKDMGELGW